MNNYSVRLCREYWLKKAGKITASINNYVKNVKSNILVSSYLVFVWFQEREPLFSSHGENALFKLTFKSLAEFELFSPAATRHKLPPASLMFWLCRRLWLLWMEQSKHQCSHWCYWEPWFSVCGFNWSNCADKMSQPPLASTNLLSVTGWECHSGLHQINSKLLGWRYANLLYAQSLQSVHIYYFVRYSHIPFTILTKAHLQKHWVLSCDEAAAAQLCN